MLPAIHHFIQRDIIRSLSQHDKQTFSELHPKDIENAIFAYHLKQLLKNGIIERNHERYSLTVDGIRYVSIATRTNIDILPSPKIFCLLVLENELGESVMHTRHAAPFTGLYTFPGGSLFYGEDLEELVQRQLVEKIGLQPQLDHKGIANLRHMHDGQTLSHNYAHIYYAQLSGRPLIKAKDARFTPAWIKIADIAEDKLMPDVQEIFKTVRFSKSFFYLEITRDN